MESFCTIAKSLSRKLISTVRLFRGYCFLIAAISIQVKRYAICLKQENSFKDVGTNVGTNVDTAEIILIFAVA